MTRLILRFMLAALACGVAVQAKDVKWDDLCKVAAKSPLKLTLDGGVTVKGVCLAQRGDVLTIASSHGTMTVNRDAIVSIRQENLRPLCTPHDASDAAAFVLLVPAFVLGDWAIPLVPVLAAAAGATCVAVLPVCAVFELIHYAAGNHAITIV